MQSAQGRIVRIAIALLSLFVAGAAYAGDPATIYYPKQSLTPGVTHPKLTPKYLCSHPTSDRRLVPLALRKAVFAAYGVSHEDQANYEVDHFIPLAPL